MTWWGQDNIIPFTDHQPGTKMPPGYYEIYKIHDIS